MRIKLPFILFLFLLLFNLTFSQEILDRIIAVVGDKIILQSELKSQYALYTSQLKPEIIDSQEKMRIKKELLEQMINDKLILIQAEKDTLLEVKSEEVDQAIDAQIERIKEQFGSETAFLEELEKENLTLKELKRKYRAQIKSQLLMEKLISLKLSGVSVSSKEVRDFYQVYKDSLPEQEEAVRLSHILFSIFPSEKTLDFLYKKAEMILNKAKSGEDFASLALIYSDDPTKDRGGDLGFFKKGDLLPEFEKTALSLNPGEAGIAKTKLGYHIIKVEKKIDSLISARHILISARPSSEDSAEIWAKADSIYQLLQKGEDFASLAKKFSDDEESKKLGGELGWYPLEQMDENLKRTISSLEKGEIGRPVLTDFGIHIVKILDKQEKRKLTKELDWDTIKDMAKRKKTNQKIVEWLKNLREKTYVEVRLEE